MALTENQRVSLRKFLNLIYRANDELADSFDTGRMSDSKSAVYEVMAAADALDVADDLAIPLRAMARAAWNCASGVEDVFSRAANASHAIGILQGYLETIEFDASADGGVHTVPPVPVTALLPAMDTPFGPSEFAAPPAITAASTTQAISVTPSMPKDHVIAADRLLQHASEDGAYEPEVVDMSGLRKRREEFDAVCVSLFQEGDIGLLKEKILNAAMVTTNADEGILYGVVDQRELRFEVLRNRSLNIAMGGATGKEVPFHPIALYNRQGQPNLSMAEAHAVLHASTVNIADIYTEQGLDFSGVRAFDAKVGYRSRSLLIVPMCDHDGKIVGALKLMNAIDPQSNKVVSFSSTDQWRVESLAAHATAAMANRRHMNQLKELFESFVTQVSLAIDGKSAYAAGHCMRVPELTVMLAEAVNASAVGPLSEVRLSGTDLYELKLAALLHDCGKVGTPIHIADKATKLQTVFDRIELINTRYEILKRDAEIDVLRKMVAAAGHAHPAALREADPELSCLLKLLNEERAFLNGCNFGTNFMHPEHQTRVKEIARRQWDGGGGERRPLLTDDEVLNLTVSQGVLTEAEHTVLNYHATRTMEMLSALRWPEHLARVPEIAGNHHERSDGTGFPRGLTGRGLSISAKILCIANLFEELTAQDCPFRRGNTVGEALAILGSMKQDGRIDSDLFDIFVREKVYLRYAERFLAQEQVREISVSNIPGYSP